MEGSVIQTHQSIHEVYKIDKVIGEYSSLTQRNIRYRQEGHS